MDDLGVPLFLETPIYSSKFTQIMYSECNSHVLGTNVSWKKQVFCCEFEVKQCCHPVQSGILQFLPSIGQFHSMIQVMRRGHSRGKRQGGRLVGCFTSCVMSNVASYYVSILMHLAVLSKNYRTVLCIIMWPCESWCQDESTLRHQTASAMCFTKSKMPGEGWREHGGSAS